MGVERSAGQVIAGRFRLVQKLGQGGMASVWTAHHLTLKVDVAVKFMDAAFAAGDETMLKRFNQEATAAATIQNPHVVKILDYGKDQGGRPYLAMELLRGEELEQRLERTGPLPIPLVQQIVVETCKGLAAAHASGVVHRDLKPENVFLCKEEEGDFSVKILDFGIARADRELSSGGNLTITGQLLGTPMFMSPEQALGKKDVDGRSDLYSLGVVAYKCLTGQTPYEESDTVGEIIVSITTKEPREPTTLRADIPPTVVAWLKKALAKDRKDRYQTAKEMADAFVEACDVRRMAVSFSGLDVDDTVPPRVDFDQIQTRGTSEPPPPPTASVSERPPPETDPPAAPVPRRSATSLAIVTVLALLAVGAAYVWLSGR